MLLNSVLCDEQFNDCMTENMKNFKRSAGCHLRYWRL